MLTFLIQVVGFGVGGYRAALRGRLRTVLPAVIIAYGTYFGLFVLLLLASSGSVPDFSALFFLAPITCGSGFLGGLFGAMQPSEEEEADART